LGTGITRRAPRASGETLVLTFGGLVVGLALTLEDVGTGAVGWA
jgi:hypothetical protein